MPGQKSIIQDVLIQNSDNIARCSRKPTAFRFEKTCCKTNNRPEIKTSSQSQWIDFPLKFLSEGTPDPIKASTTLMDNARYTIINNTLMVQYIYSHDDNTGFMSGVGFYKLDLPTIPLSPLLDYSNFAGQHVGTFTIISADEPNPKQSNMGVVSYDESDDSLVLEYFDHPTGLLQMIMPGDLSKDQVFISVTATLQLAPP